MPTNASAERRKPPERERSEARDRTDQGYNSRLGPTGLINARAAAAHPAAAPLAPRGCCRRDDRARGHRRWPRVLRVAGESARGRQGRRDGRRWTDAGRREARARGALACARRNTGDIYGGRPLVAREAEPVGHLGQLGCRGLHGAARGQRAGSGPRLSPPRGTTLRRGRRSLSSGVRRRTDLRGRPIRRRSRPAASRGGARPQGPDAADRPRTGRADPRPQCCRAGDRPGARFAVAYAGGAASRSARFAARRGGRPAARRGAGSYSALCARTSGNRADALPASALPHRPAARPAVRRSPSPAHRRQERRRILRPSPEDPGSRL